MKNECHELIIKHYDYMKKVLKMFKKSSEWTEDIAQETCVKAIMNFKSCNDLTKFKGWFTQIAVNTAKNNLRSDKTKFHADGYDLNRIQQKSDAPDIQLSDLILLDEIVTMIDKLPERQRESFYQRFINDCTFGEIAELMDCPYDTAKANYRHALLKLRGDFNLLLL